MKKIDEKGKELFECPSCIHSRVVFPYDGNMNDTLCLKTGKKWRFWNIYTFNKFPDFCPLQSIQ